jgi:streptogramin lyase
MTSKAFALAGVLITALTLAASLLAAPAKHTVIRVPGSPAQIGVAFGSVWILDHRVGVLRRIDPKTNRVRTIEIGESLCSVPAFGDGAVWVWGCDSNHIYKIDAATNRIVLKREGKVPAYGAGSLWILTDDDKISRVDPRTGVVLATVDPKLDAEAGGPDVVADGSLWVSGDSAVARIDVNTNKVTSVIPLPGWKPSGNQPSGLLGANYGIYANGNFWDTNAAGIYKINPTTNTAALLKIPLHPLSQWGDVPITSGSGSLWVRTSDTSIARINPQTDQITARYPAAGGGGEAVPGFGSLWIANFGAGSIWRTHIN